MELSLAVEQVNFEVDDVRHDKQSIDSFSSLVNYNSEFQTSNHDNQNIETGKYSIKVF
jgi:hypothetical protein